MFRYQRLAAAAARAALHLHARRRHVTTTPSGGSSELPSETSTLMAYVSVGALFGGGAVCGATSMLDGRVVPVPLHERLARDGDEVAAELGARVAAAETRSVACAAAASNASSVYTAVCSEVRDALLPKCTATVTRAGDVLAQLSSWGAPQDDPVVVAAQTQRAAALAMRDAGLARVEAAKAAHDAAAAASQTAEKEGRAAVRRADRATRALAELKEALAA
jgi:hypothetical protein